MSGLGDEAFACRFSDDIEYGKTEADAKTYVIGGAIVEVRSGNAILEVDWGAATYSSQSGKRLTGTNLGYTDARDQAVAVAKHLLAGLS